MAVGHAVDWVVVRRRHGRTLCTSGVPRGDIAPAPELRSEGVYTTTEDWVSNSIGSSQPLAYSSAMDNKSVIIL